MAQNVTIVFTYSKWQWDGLCNLCIQAIAANKTFVIFWLLQGATLVVAKWSKDPWTWTAKKPTTSGAAFLSQVCHSFKYHWPPSVTLFYFWLWHDWICTVSSILPMYMLQLVPLLLLLAFVLALLSAYFLWLTQIMPQPQYFGIAAAVLYLSANQQHKIIDENG